MNSSSSGLKIFLIGNRGYISKILEILLQNNESIVGICCRKENYSLRAKLKNFLSLKLINLDIYKKESFEFSNPFNRFESPQNIAARKRIPILYSDKLCAPEFEMTLRRLNPDLILVAGFHRKIPINVINVPKKAIINFHPSLLPNHRGGTPNRWVIRNNEKETGVTVHFVNERIDSGDIIIQEKIRVNPDEAWGDLELRIIDLISRLVLDILKMIKNGDIKSVPQNNSEATYEPSFRGCYQEIDWSLPSSEIKQICYAIRPKSGGIAIFEKRKLCIWDVQVFSESFFYPPGTIVDIDNDGFPIVSCGKGCIKILSFLQNGKIINAPEIIRNFNIRVKEKFE